MKKHYFVKKWNITIARKITKLIKKSTYQLIQKKIKQKKISLIWVFNYKFDKDDYLMKFKTRLCVWSDLQIIDKDTYVIILVARTFKALIIISTPFDLKIWRYNAINVFVNNFLNKNIYCNTSEYFKKIDICWKL